MSRSIGGGFGRRIELVDIIRILPRERRVWRVLEFESFGSPKGSKIEEVALSNSMGYRLSEEGLLELAGDVDQTVNAVAVAANDDLDFACSYDDHAEGFASGIFEYLDLVADSNKESQVELDLGRYEFCRAMVEIHDSSSVALGVNAGAPGWAETLSAFAKL